MSPFNPTHRVVLADDAPDLLAGGILNALTRPVYYAVSWGAIRSFVFIVLTLGFAPMLAMITWLRLLITQHQQQMWHLAEWLRLQNTDPQAAELQASAEKIRFSYFWAAVALICTLVAVAAVTIHFRDLPFHLRAFYQFAFSMPRSPAQISFACAMAGAALANLGHVVRHQQNMGRFITRFNAITGRIGVDTVPLPEYESGIRPIWIFAGLALLFMGAGWAAMVMVAMAAHRRYTMVSSVRIRAMLAERLRAMLLARRPAIPAPKPIGIVRACNRPNCQAPLQTGAAFCPRCGAKAQRAMELVA